MPRDWIDLVDKRAALKEQFPRLQALMNERPGCQVDRDRQARYREENRRSVERAEQAAMAARHQEQDADRFIERMQRWQRETFLARLAEKNHERKTA